MCYIAIESLTLNLLLNQIPTSSLSFGRSRPGFSSEVAIVVKHKSKGTQSKPAA